MSVFIDEAQEHENWCWAAATASVYRYFYPEAPKKQCEIASDVLGDPACCAVPLPAPLDHTAHLQDALTSLKLNHTLDGPLPFTKVQQQLDASLPVCVRIQWPEQDRGHFVVIIGYVTTDTGEQWLDVADPFFGYMSVPYDWLVHSYFYQGSWSDSFLLQAPATA